MPAGSGFSSLTLCWTHVRSAAAAARGQEQPAEEDAQAAAGSSSGQQRGGRAAQQRQAQQHRNGQAEPGQERLQQAAERPTVLGTARWNASSPAVSTASAARTRPRVQTRPPLGVPAPAPRPSARRRRHRRRHTAARPFHHCFPSVRVHPTRRPTGRIGFRLGRPRSRGVGGVSGLSARCRWGSALLALSAFKERT